MNDYISSYPENVCEYVKTLTEKYNANDIIAYLDCIKNLKVLALGETIIDEYIYCDALGKSGKEATLAMKYRFSERYAGGILAIANHLSNFCDNITVVSYIGDRNTEEEFIHESLNKNIETVLIRKSKSPTIVKKKLGEAKIIAQEATASVLAEYRIARIDGTAISSLTVTPSKIKTTDKLVIIDKYSLAKLLGVYDLNNEWLNEKEEKELLDILKKRIAEFDVVLIADYDHGLITPEIVNFLADNAKFLAVNTQVNAANIGFHAISKYHRADFICTNESEVRLDRRNRNGELKSLIKELTKKISCDKIMITRGTRGTIIYTNNSFVECPAFALKIVDRVGAGDAVLSVTSLLAAKNTPTEVISFVGNLIGAEAVAVIGNKEPVNKECLINAIKNFLN